MKLLIQALGDFIEKPRRGRRLWLIVATILAALAIVGLVAVYVFPSTVSVPDLTGMTPSDADKKLHATHLQVGRAAYQPKATQTPGTIVDQDPKANEHEKRGLSVNVVL